VETIKELLADRKTYNVRSILRFRPKKEHHNRTFTCQAHNRPAKTVKSEFIRLYVKYAPKVVVKVHSPKLHEGMKKICLKLWRSSTEYPFFLEILNK